MDKRQLQQQQQHQQRQRQQQQEQQQQQQQVQEHRQLQVQGQAQVQQQQPPPPPGVTYVKVVIPTRPVVAGWIINAWAAISALTIQRTYAHIGFVLPIANNDDENRGPALPERAAAAE
ncbi:hypothetical protein RI367_008384 [Sorochytrium milnesiophthora]